MGHISSCHDADLGAFAQLAEFNVHGHLAAVLVNPGLRLAIQAEIFRFFDATE